MSQAQLIRRGKNSDNAIYISSALDLPPSQKAQPLAARIGEIRCVRRSIGRSAASPPAESETASRARGTQRFFRRSRRRKARPAFRGQLALMPRQPGETRLNIPGIGARNLAGGNDLREIADYEARARGSRCPSGNRAPPIISCQPRRESAGRSAALCRPTLRRTLTRLRNAAAG